MVTKSTVKGCVRLSSEYKVTIEGKKAVIKNTTEQMARYATIKLSSESIITNDDLNGVTIRYNRYTENKWFFGNFSA